MTSEEATRYVLAECVETGITKCFAKVPPRAERSKDPFKRRKFYIYYWFGDWSKMSELRASPFWSNPRYITSSELPQGITPP